MRMTLRLIHKVQACHDDRVSNIDNYSDRLNPLEKAIERPL